MTLARPDARLALASGTPLGLAEAGAARVQVDLSLGEGHDAVLVRLWPGSKLSAARAGDPFTVALGTGDDDPEQVLAAEVVGVDVLPGATLLSALAPTHRLGRSYVGRSWRATTLGQVVRDLLDEGGVDAGTVDASLVLPALHVDPHRSVWSALHDLARRTGHQVTTTPDGAVSFSPAPGAAGAGGGLGGLAGAAAAAASSLLGLGGTSLREGADLVTASRGTRLAAAATGPLGPRATPAGTAAWYQLEAEPDDGSTVTVLDPALRTREAADAATSAAAGAAVRRGTVADLHVTGRPGLRPSQRVDVEAGGGTTSYRLLSVRHTLDGTGYTCRLRAEAAS
jgi:phage protein D